MVTGTSNDRARKTAHEHETTALFVLSLYRDILTLPGWAYNQGSPGVPLRLLEAFISPLIQCQLELVYVPVLPASTVPEFFSSFFMAWRRQARTKAFLLHQTNDF
jgi:hypothetical protein